MCIKFLGIALTFTQAIMPACWSNSCYTLLPVAYSKRRVAVASGGISKCQLQFALGAYMGIQM